MYICNTKHYIENTKNCVIYRDNVKPFKENSDKTRKKRHKKLV